MRYKHLYKTPKGFSDMIMTSDGENLTALVFEGSRDTKKIEDGANDVLLPIFNETIKWLDIYFSGKNPDFEPMYKIEKLTPFRESVIEEMAKIPYGETATYSGIADNIARKKGLGKMSAQAIGGAVGFNPICIIVPCHRVVGAGGNLTGYGGGIDNKIALLRLEGALKKEFFVPKKRGAL